MPDALSHIIRLVGLVARSLGCWQLSTEHSSFDSGLLPRRSMYIQLQPSVTLTRGIPLLASTIQGDDTKREVQHPPKPKELLSAAA